LLFTILIYLTHFFLYCIGALCITLDKPQGTWSLYDGYTGNTGEYDSDNDGERDKASGVIRSKIPTGAEIFQNTVQAYVQHSNQVHVLSMIISSFSGSYYASTAMEMVTLIGSSSGCSRRGSGNNTPTKGRSGNSFSSFPSFHPQAQPLPRSQINSLNMNFDYPTTHTHSHTPSTDDRADVHSGRTYALAALGKQLTLHPPPESQKRCLLREVWKLVGCTDSLSAYVTCVGAWLIFAKNHCG
jgi:hypothetical protein